MDTGGNKTEETETLEEDEFEDEDGRTATEESNPPDRPRKISAVPAPNIINERKQVRKNRSKIPRIQNLNVIPGIKEMKVTWDTLLREEFDDIQFIIQWRRMGEQKGWRRGESKKQSYIIKNLTPETDYEVKVSALCDKVISPAEQTHVCTDRRLDFNEESEFLSPPHSPVVYAQRKLCVIIVNDFKNGMHPEQIVSTRELFDFFDKTLRFKTVVKLENQPREKIREWFKALDRSKMFEGFEMFVCLIIGFGNYHGFHCNDEEFLSFHEIYKHTKDKFGDKPKVILVDISHVPNSRVPSMTNGNVRITENSSREVILEWTPPRYQEGDQVQFHVECFKGSQKVKEVFQLNTRVEFANLEHNTQYRFHITPVLGKDRKQHGNLAYANIRTKGIVKDTDVLSVRNLCAQRLSDTEILVYWDPPEIRKTSHLVYIVSWSDHSNLTKRSEKETKKTSFTFTDSRPDKEQLVKVTIKAYDDIFFPVSFHVESYTDVLRPTHVTAMSESHSVFWVDWQFPADKQDLLEKFVIVCSDCLSFRKSRVKSFDVGKEMRCFPVYYIPEIPYAYVKVVPVALQNPETAEASVESLEESVIARIETDKASRLIATSKTSNSCEVIWWVDIQDREMVSNYTAHCKPLDPRKKRFKPVSLKLGPECRQVHEIVKLESNTNYSVSIYRQSKMYTQQIKVKTLPKGNPENLTITVMSSFEVNVNWSESYISEESEQKYIVEYKCDPTIMKNPVRKLVSSHSVYLTDLIPEVQYEVSVRNKEKGDPSIKSFRTPQFGPSNLVDQVTSSEIFLAWVNPVLPKDFPVPLQYQVVLEREDGTKRRGVVTYHKKSSRFKCEFGRLWSATSYAVKCFTLVEGKRKYAPTVIKLKTKNDHLRTLLEPRGDNFVISFASRDIQSSSESDDEASQPGLYMTALLHQFREDFLSKSVDELLRNINGENLTSYTVTNINYCMEKVMLDSPKTASKDP
ncbi:uncharacterized protein LOC111131447 isoform X3 [Crassostrea virginica]